MTQQQQKQKAEAHHMVHANSAILGLHTKQETFSAASSHSADTHLYRHSITEPTTIAATQVLGLCSVCVFVLLRPLCPYLVSHVLVYRSSSVRNRCYGCYRLCAVCVFPLISFSTPARVFSIHSMPFICPHPLVHFYPVPTLPRLNFLSLSLFHFSPLYGISA